MARGATSTSPAGTELVPTFLLDTPPDAAICTEACFAPLAAVIPFDSLDDAVALGTPIPLRPGRVDLLGRRRGRARLLAARIPAGHVSINDALAPTAHPATPFGGVGASGWGVTQGEEGLLAMTVPQTVTVRKGTFRPHFDEAANARPGDGGRAAGPVAGDARPRDPREAPRALAADARGQAEEEVNLQSRPSFCPPCAEDVGRLHVGRSPRSASLLRLRGDLPVHLHRLLERLLGLGTLGVGDARA